MQGVLELDNENSYEIVFDSLTDTTFLIHRSTYGRTFKLKV